MKTLHSHQSRAIDLLRQSLSSGRRRPMLQIPTGGGKTVVAADIIRTARDKGNRVLFVVDAITLIDQTVERLYEHGLSDIGVIQADHIMTDYSKPIQVASVQTLARRQPPPFGLCIVDEAHAQYATVRALMEDNPKVPFIGLSATPWSKGLGNSYDDLIVPVTMRELIDLGHLSPFQVYAPTHPDLSKVKTTAGDYNEDDLSKVMGDQALIADIVSTWRARGQGKPTLCFCVDREHAATVRDRFVGSGVPCGYIDALTPIGERKAIERQLDAGEIDVVTNVGCLTKGVDWAVGCIILARPTKSASLAVQMIGRGLRVNNGTRAEGDCIILDHTDTVLRLGFPTDIHRADLCKAQKGERQQQQATAKVPHECPACSRLTTGKCLCGYVKPRQESMLTEGSGQLAQLTGGRSAGQSAGKPKPKDKQIFYREVLGYARLKGKEDKFAAGIFNARYHEWPARKHGLEPISPSPETLAYIRSRQIAYAKSQEWRKS